jgi:hypothetical protein
MTAGIDEQSASYSVKQKSDHRVRHNDMAVHQNITDPAAVSQKYLFEDETEQMKSQLGKQIDKKALYVYNQSNKKEQTKLNYI